ncbi:hypothetical protein B1C78_16105 [Thioalkalivibrio denitrificans]|uniref:Transcription elongation factor GreA/GreB C-terminal domain-containing protein n=1 Tax=Thioalkalivibrio denitrificans TaxID=108003 RepID=A0A1V3N9K3_9GAMM|nr:GreA/GreB family elongation factor [Thioalkalivibrio denitrificans]OOG21486.1 hypothetical protein B1C78_16105 [Thioalkalivibrio denitrificans]
MSERLKELKHQVLQQLEQYYLHTHLGLSLGPQELASILGKLENLENLDVADMAPADQHIERVRIGSRVRLLDLQDNSEAEIELVLPVDSAPPSGRISIFSPLGASILGLAPAEYAEIRFLGRPLRYLVLEVLPPDTAQHGHAPAEQPVAP